MHLDQISRAASPATENDAEHGGSPELTRFETHRLKNFLSLDPTRCIYNETDCVVP